MSETVTCEICGFQGSCLTSHVTRIHGVSCEEYRDRYPRASLHSDSWRKHSSAARKGKRFTEEHKRKLSEAQKGRPRKPLSEEHKRKLSETQKGRIFTKEHRRRLSEAATGRNHSEESIRKMVETRNGPNGFRHTEETKAKLREISREWIRIHGNPMQGRKGKDAPGWIDGRSYERYPWEFTSKREIIRERDNYTCQKCGKTDKEHVEEKGRALSVHHIDYNKKNNVQENLITLCHDCNLEVNKNRSYWTRYFTNMMTPIIQV